jgi:hypothetical protein
VTFLVYTRQGVPSLHPFRYAKEFERCLRSRVLPLCVFAVHYWPCRRRSYRWNRAAIPAAEVILKNTHTGTQRKFPTDDSGLYSFTAVPPGTYDVSVSKTGFSAATASLQVYSSQTTAQNFSMRIGEQSSVVTVSVENTSDPRASEPLRSSRRNTLDIETFPNLGRNIVNMITLAPGVTPTFSPAGQMNANGGGSKATSHQLDFADANDGSSAG